MALDESLADEILKDAGGDPVHSALVAFALRNCLKSRAGGFAPADHDSFKAGRLRGAIGQRAGGASNKFRT